MRARRLFAAALFPLAACAEPPPPAPPPFAGEVRPQSDEAALLAPMLSAVPEAAPAPSAAPAVPVGPVVHFAIEAPFRLDQRVFPKTKAAFLADLADRTAWNKGDLGELAAELPPVPGHPAPKVIIDVTRATGGLRAADAQRVLRKGFWIKVVECFSLSAYKDQKLRGAAAFTLGVVAGGKVSAVRVGKHDFKEPDVPRCLGNQLRAFALPAAKGRSTLSVEIQVGHGDEPVPPPASLIVPGEGTLAPDQIAAATEAARPAFEACYKAALDYAPALWGRLGIRFHVTEKGKTDEAFEVESRFPDERVTLCVLRAARQMTFPVPAGGDIRFVVPLRFWSDRSAIQKPPDPG
jgi:hypothetical protein